MGKEGRDRSFFEKSWVPHSIQYQRLNLKMCQGLSSIKRYFVLREKPYCARRKVGKGNFFYNPLQITYTILQLIWHWQQSWVKPLWQRAIKYLKYNKMKLYFTKKTYITKSKLPTFAVGKMTKNGPCYHKYNERKAALKLLTIRFLGVLLQKRRWFELNLKNIDAWINEIFSTGVQLMLSSYHTVFEMYTVHQCRHFHW